MAEEDEDLLTTVSRGLSQPGSLLSTSRSTSSFPPISIPATTRMQSRLRLLWRVPPALLRKASSPCRGLGQQSWPKPACKFLLPLVEQHKHSHPQTSRIRSTLPPCHSLGGCGACALLLDGSLVKQASCHALSYREKKHTGFCRERCYLLLHEFRGEMGRGS